MTRAGIDPDIDKSGLALYDKENHVIELYSLSLDTLVDMLERRREEISEVVVEASWLIHMTTWHGRRGDSAGVIAKKGYHVGRNHQRGIDIVELLRARGLNVTERKPFNKCWKGPDGKITHEELAKLLTGPQFRCEFTKKRTNQEERDAALLAIM